MEVRSRGMGRESCEIVRDAVVSSWWRTNRVQCVGVMLIGSRRKQLSRLEPSGCSRRRRWYRGMASSLLGSLITSRNDVDRTCRVSENGEC